MIMNVYFFTKENFWIGLNCFQNRVQSNFQTEYWNLNRNFCWATTNDFFFAVMSKSLVWRNTFRYQCEFSSSSILFRQFRCLLCRRRLLCPAELDCCGLPLGCGWLRWCRRQFCCLRRRRRLLCLTELDCCPSCGCLRWCCHWFRRSSCGLCRRDAQDPLFERPWIHSPCRGVFSHQGVLWICVCLGHTGMWTFFCSRGIGASHRCHVSPNSASIFRYTFWTPSRTQHICKVFLQHPICNKNHSIRCWNSIFKDWVNKSANW